MNATRAELKSIIKSGVPLLIEGPTGTGKTYTLMELAEEAGVTLHVINVSGELTVDSILGQQTLVNGNVEWRDGVLTNAMRNGKAWVLFDELNTALPEVLTVINGILDDSRAVTLPNSDNERVTAHKDFRFVATQNPAGGSYAGTARLNDALVNRMVKLTMGYMEFEEEVRALKKHTKLSGSTVVQLVKLADYTRRNLDDDLSTRDLVKVLRLKEEGGMTLKDALKTVILTRFSRDDYEKLYEYHSVIMSELRRLGAEDKDPFEVIKQRLRDIETREDELRKEKNNLRTAVRKEILTDLLADKTTTSGVPKDF